MPPVTRDFLNVELMTTGTWDGRGCPPGGCEFNAETLEDIVQATQEAMSQGMKSPVKLGHGNSQKLLEQEGLPAAGWLDNVRVAGNSVVADIKQVPKRIADLMEAGGWRNRSVELRRRDGKLVLTGLALLGSTLPAIDTLKDIEALYAELDLGDPDETVIVFANKDDIDHTSEWLDKIAEAHPSAKQHVDALRLALKPSTGDQDMDLTTIAQKLGLEGEVTEEQVLAKLDELNKPPESGDEPKPNTVDASKKDDDDDDEEVTKLSARVLELETREAASNARAAVEKAIDDGKLLPAQREQSMKFALRDPDGFNDFIKSQPTILEFGERGTSSGGGDNDESEFEPTKLELDLAKQTGLSREEIIVQKMRDAGREPSTQLLEAAFGKKD